MEMEQRDWVEQVYSLSNRKGGDFEYIKNSLALYFEEPNNRSVGR